MRRLVFCLALFALPMIGCKAPQPPPPSARESVWKYLSSNGLRPVDVTEMVLITKNSDGYNAELPESTLCQSAYWSGAYRAFTTSNQTVIGVACVEQDNTVTIALQSPPR